MTPSEDAEGESRRKPMSTSRRISLAIYGVLLAFVTVSGFQSVIPQVFWPVRADDHRAPIADCGAEVSSLERVLLDRAADHIRSGGGPPSATQPAWLGEWDDRFHQLELSCPDQNITSLERLRFRIERTLWRFDRNEGERVAELPQLADGARP